MGRMVRLLTGSAAGAVLFAWLAAPPSDDVPLQLDVPSASSASLPVSRVSPPPEAREARAAMLASPFGDGPAVLAGEGEVEFRELNRAIDPVQLTAVRPQLAESFLHQVELQPDPRGGFVVGAVAPESLAARLGLQRGDVLLTLDSPENAAVDENPATVLQQTQVALQVTRDGRVLQLRAALDADADDATGRR